MNRNNLHKKGYDFDRLQKAYPALTPFIITNKKGEPSIDFADPKAVKMLNTALLFVYYHIKYWQFSDEHLCPAVPGRADYIHYIHDLLQNSLKIRSNRFLDIGTGASLIYPLLGHRLYRWKFVATDINNKSIEQAQKISKLNKVAKDISLRLQTNKEAIFKGIISEKEQFAASICNPPFYSSLEEANKATTQKIAALNKTNLSSQKPIRNFSGKNHELWYKGGEKAFLHNYLYESSFYKEQVGWFSILVSNKKYIKGMQESLNKLGVAAIKIIPMQHGNKITRIIAWTFL